MQIEFRSDNVSCELTREQVEREASEGGEKNQRQNSNQDVSHYEPVPQSPQQL